MLDNPIDSHPENHRNIIKISSKNHQNIIWIHQLFLIDESTWVYIMILIKSSNKNLISSYQNLQLINHETQRIFWKDDFKNFVLLFAWNLFFLCEIKFLEVLSSES